MTETWKEALEQFDYYKHVKAEKVKGKATYKVA